VLSDRIGRTRTMMLAFALQAVNMLAFRHYTTPGLVVFGAAFTGICYGGIFTLMPTATADFFGIRNLGVNYGLVFTAFGFAGVLGPMLAAGIHDQQHSYALAFQISAGMLILGVILAFFTKSPDSPAASKPVLSPVGAALPKTA
jgi:MFS family permease